MLFYIEFPKSQTQVSERDRGILDFDSNCPTFLDRKQICFYSYLSMLMGAWDLPPHLGNTED